METDENGQHTAAEKTSTTAADTCARAYDVVRRCEAVRTESELQRRTVPRRISQALEQVGIPPWNRFLRPQGTAGRKQPPLTAQPPATGRPVRTIMRPLSELDTHIARQQMAQPNPLLRGLLHLATHEADARAAIAMHATSAHSSSSSSSSRVSAATGAGEPMDVVVHSAAAAQSATTPLLPPPPPPPSWSTEQTQSYADSNWFRDNGGMQGCSNFLRMHRVKAQRNAETNAAGAGHDDDQRACVTEGVAYSLQRPVRPCVCAYPAHCARSRFVPRVIGKYAERPCVNGSLCWARNSLPHPLSGVPGLGLVLKEYLTEEQYKIALQTGQHPAVHGPCVVCLWAEADVDSVFSKMLTAVRCAPAMYHPVDVDGGYKSEACVRWQSGEGVLFIRHFVVDEFHPVTLQTLAEQCGIDDRSHRSAYQQQQQQQPAVAAGAASLSPADASRININIPLLEEERNSIAHMTPEERAMIGGYSEDASVYYFRETRWLSPQAASIGTEPRAVSTPCYAALALPPGLAGISALPVDNEDGVTPAADAQTRHTDMSPAQCEAEIATAAALLTGVDIDAATVLLGPFARACADVAACFAHVERAPGPTRAVPPVANALVNAVVGQHIWSCIALPRPVSAHSIFVTLFTRMSMLDDIRRAIADGTAGIAHEKACVRIQSAAEAAAQNARAQNAFDQATATYNSALACGCSEEEARRRADVTSMRILGTPIRPPPPPALTPVPPTARQQLVLQRAHVRAEYHSGRTADASTVPATAATGGSGTGRDDSVRLSKKARKAVRIRRRLMQPDAPPASRIASAAGTIPASTPHLAVSAFATAADSAAHAQDRGAVRTQKTSSRLLLVVPGMQAAHIPAVRWFSAALARHRRVDDEAIAGLDFAVDVSRERLRAAGVRASAAMGTLDPTVRLPPMPVRNTTIATREAAAPPPTSVVRLVYPSHREAVAEWLGHEPLSSDEDATATASGAHPREAGCRYACTFTLDTKLSDAITEAVQIVSAKHGAWWEWRVLLPSATAAPPPPTRPCPDRFLTFAGADMLLVRDAFLEFWETAACIARLGPDADLALIDACGGARVPHQLRGGGEMDAHPIAATSSPRRYSLAAAIVVRTLLADALTQCARDHIASYRAHAFGMTHADLALAIKWGMDGGGGGNATASLPTSDAELTEMPPIPIPPPRQYHYNQPASQQSTRTASSAPTPTGVMTTSIAEWAYPSDTRCQTAGDVPSLAALLTECKYFEQPETTPKINTAAQALGKIVPRACTQRHAKDVTANACQRQMPFAHFIVSSLELTLNGGYPHARCRPPFQGVLAARMIAQSAENDIHTRAREFRPRAAYIVHVESARKVDALHRTYALRAGGALRAAVRDACALDATSRMCTRMLRGPAHQVFVELADAAVVAVTGAVAAELHRELLTEAAASHADRVLYVPDGFVTMWGRARQSLTGAVTLTEHELATTHQLAIAVRQTLLADPGAYDEIVDACAVLAAGDALAIASDHHHDSRPLGGTVMRFLEQVDAVALSHADAAHDVFAKNPQAQAVIDAGMRGWTPGADVATRHRAIARATLHAARVLAPHNGVCLTSAAEANAHPDMRDAVGDVVAGEVDAELRRRDFSRPAALRAATAVRGGIFGACVTWDSVVCTLHRDGDSGVGDIAATDKPRACTDAHARVAFVSALTDILKPLLPRDGGDANDVARVVTQRLSSAVLLGMPHVFNAAVGRHPLLNPRHAKNALDGVNQLGVIGRTCIKAMERAASRKLPNLIDAALDSALPFPLYYHHGDGASGADASGDAEKDEDRDISEDIRRIVAPDTTGVADDSGIRQRQHRHHHRHHRRHAEWTDKTRVHAHLVATEWYIALLRRDARLAIGSQVLADTESRDPSEAERTSREDIITTAGVDADVAANRAQSAFAAIQARRTQTIGPGTMTTLDTHSTDGTLDKDAMAELEPLALRAIAHAILYSVDLTRQAWLYAHCATVCAGTTDDAVRCMTYRRAAAPRAFVAAHPYLLQCVMRDALVNALGNNPVINSALLYRSDWFNNGGFVDLIVETTDWIRTTVGCGPRTLAPGYQTGGGVAVAAAVAATGNDDTDEVWRPSAASVAIAHPRTLVHTLLPDDAVLKTKYDALNKSPNRSIFRIYMTNETQRMFHALSQAEASLHNLGVVIEDIGSNTPGSAAYNKCRLMWEYCIADSDAHGIPGTATGVRNHVRDLDALRGFGMSDADLVVMSNIYKSYYNFDGDVDISKLVYDLSVHGFVIASRYYSCRSHADDARVVPIMAREVSECAIAALCMRHGISCGEPVPARFYTLHICDACLNIVSQVAPRKASYANVVGNYGVAVDGQGRCVCAARRSAGRKREATSSKAKSSSSGSAATTTTTGDGNEDEPSSSTTPHPELSDDDDDDIDEDEDEDEEEEAPRAINQQIRRQLAAAATPPPPAPSTSLSSHQQPPQETSLFNWTQHCIRNRTRTFSTLGAAVVFGTHFGSKTKQPADGNLPCIITPCCGQFMRLHTEDAGVNGFECIACSMRRGSQRARAPPCVACGCPITTTAPTASRDNLAACYAPRWNAGAQSLYQERLDMRLNTPSALAGHRLVADGRIPVSSVAAGVALVIDDIVAGAVVPADLCADCAQSPLVHGGRWPFMLSTLRRATAIYRRRRDTRHNAIVSNVPALLTALNKRGTAKKRPRI